MSMPAELKKVEQDVNVLKLSNHLERDRRAYR